MALSAGRADADEALTVNVNVQNYAGVSDRDLRDAEAQTARIYATAGIIVEWGTADARGLRLVIVSADMAKRLPASADALGFAPTDESGTRGLRAYVFAGKIRDAADQLRLDFARFLGCVMAHELGHLLLPFHSHTASGIMRGAWDSAHLPIPGSGYLRFVPAQVEALNVRLRAEGTNR
jgi:hypothetical protein